MYIPAWIVWFVVFFLVLLCLRIILTSALLLAGIARLAAFLLALIGRPNRR